MCIDYLMSQSIKNASGVCCILSMSLSGPLGTETQLDKLLEFVWHHTVTSGSSEVQLLDGQLRKIFTFTDGEMALWLLLVFGTLQAVLCLILDTLNIIYQHNFWYIQRTSWLQCLRPVTGNVGRDPSAPHLSSPTTNYTENLLLNQCVS